MTETLLDAPPKKSVQIDEDGYLISNGIRLTDEVYGREILQSIFCKNRAFYSKYNGETILIESFSEPLVARGLQKCHVAQGTFVGPYGTSFDFEMRSLRVDAWDRFHGKTTTGVNFVFSRQGQMEFFDACDEFDDDSVVINNNRFHLMPLYDLSAPVESPGFWKQKYDRWDETGEKPGWELGESAAALKDIHAQLKFPKQRVCVLGSGVGHDAAFFASQGHVVTAVDFSSEAISKAKNLYPETPQLKHICADVFNFAAQESEQFDLIFDHTFYCAIKPNLRMQLVKSWKMLLAEGGHYLGIIFILDRTSGPPYGTTEWEVREEMKADFDFLYWTRWRHSIPRRMGKELVIYAQKKT